MKATDNNVIISPTAGQQETETGIVLDVPGSEPKMSYHGTIVDAGPECKRSYVPGQQVVYRVQDGFGETVNGQHVVFVPESAIKAIL